MLFADLQARKVNLVSLKEGIDLGTAAGRMMANVLASVAQYETELRAERINAGIAAAKAEGKTWGGRKAGTRIKLTVEKERTIKMLAKTGESVAAIARAVELSRPTVDLGAGEISRWQGMTDRHFQVFAALIHVGRDTVWRTHFPRRANVYVDRLGSPDQPRDPCQGRRDRRPEPSR